MKIQKKNKWQEIFNLFTIKLTETKFLKYLAQFELNIWPFLHANFLKSFVIIQ